MAVRKVSKEIIHVLAYINSLSSFLTCQSLLNQNIKTNVFRGCFLGFEIRQGKFRLGTFFWSARFITVLQNIFIL